MRLILPKKLELRTFQFKLCRGGGAVNAPGLSEAFLSKEKPHAQKKGLFEKAPGFFINPAHLKPRKPGSHKERR